MNKADSRAPFRVHELGEIAIRCSDMDAMVAFYRDIVGLDVLADNRDTGIAFFKIRAGTGGHTNVLALFHHEAGRADLHAQSDEPPETGARSSLHHLALTVSADDQPAIEGWLKRNDVAYQIQAFDWIGWRGIFVSDPEGNTVEFVAGSPHFKSDENVS